MAYAAAQGYAFAQPAPDAFSMPTALSVLVSPHDQFGAADHNAQSSHAGAARVYDENLHPQPVQPQHAVARVAGEPHGSTCEPISAIPSTSGTSRRNKLQRCSACGGLGHKSRTCALASKSMMMAPKAVANSVPDVLPSSPHSQQIVAAHGLLALAQDSRADGSFNRMTALSWA